MADVEADVKKVVARAYLTNIKTILIKAGQYISTMCIHMDDSEHKDYAKAVYRAVQGLQKQLEFKIKKLEK